MVTILKLDFNHTVDKQTIRKVISNINNNVNNNNTNNNNMKKERQNK